MVRKSQAMIVAFVIALPTFLLTVLMPTYGYAQSGEWYVHRTSHHMSVPPYYCYCYRRSTSSVLPATVTYPMDMQISEGLALAKLLAYTSLPDTCSENCPQGIGRAGGSQGGREGQHSGRSGFNDLTLLGSGWREVENNISGTWVRRGNTNVFDGTWENGAIAVLEMTLKGKKVTISRYDPAGASKGFRITYQGLISADGKSVSGKEHWPGGISDWSATIRK